MRNSYEIYSIFLLKLLFFKFWALPFIEANQRKCQVKIPIYSIIMTSEIKFKANSL